MIHVAVVQSSLDIEQCLDIRRSVFCGLMNMVSDEVFDDLDGRAVHCLAEFSGKPIGAGRMVSKGGEWWMELVAVLPAFRGKGCARQIIDTLLKEASKRQIPELRVKTSPVFKDFLAKMNYQDGVIPVELEKG